MLGFVMNWSHQAIGLKSEARFGQGGVRIGDNPGDWFNTNERGLPMPMTRCAYCQLPTRIHFAWCQESGVKGNMPPEALRPGSIVADARELRWCKPVTAIKSSR